MSKPFYEIYNFLGSSPKYNRIDYSEYRDYDVRYNYSFREGETQTFKVKPSNNDLTKYSYIELKLYSNNAMVVKWSGDTSGFTLSEDHEVFIDGNEITINLSSDKSQILTPGILALMIKVEGAQAIEYQIYLGEVYKGF